MVCGLDIQVGQDFVLVKMNTFIDMHTMKHSFVIAGHLHWLRLKLPDNMLHDG